MLSRLMAVGGAAPGGPPVTGGKPKTRWGLIVGLPLGLLLGVVITGVVGVVGSRLIVDMVLGADAVDKHEPTFTLTVARRNLAPGQVLTFDDIGQAVFPQRLRTASHVPVEEAVSIVDQTLRVPVKEGEPIRWVFFDVPTAPDRTVLEECRRGIAQHPEILPTEHTVEDIRARILGGGHP